jgi:hypothetical protein
MLRSNSEMQPRVMTPGCRVEAFMGANLAEPLSLEMMAREAR